MSQRIIESAVTETRPHPGLAYRTLSLTGEDEDDTAEIEPQTGDVPLPSVQPISGEFACLLSVI